MTILRDIRPNNVLRVEDFHTEGFRLASMTSLNFTGTVSHDFISRLLNFVSWQAGWDGGEASRIPVPAAMRALTLAEKSLLYAGEPFVAPADGALLLRWRLPQGQRLEVFVDEDEPESVAHITDEGVRELRVRSEDEVVRLLADMSGAILLADMGGAITTRP